MIKLCIDKNRCCGCAACMSICPPKAINMEADTDGYIFPNINHNLCIECGKCIEVCISRKAPSVHNEPQAIYAAINKNKDVLMTSASGGIFVALASLVLEKNGVVFGCAYNVDMEPQHVCVDNTADLKKLQGSKYVQSNINNSYIEAGDYLKTGKWVLFTGTPCQIAGLKSYLGTNYNNLITADIICHGVPNVQFFKGYIKYLEEKLKGNIIDVNFRNKSKGWGHLEKIVYEQNGREKYKLIHSANSYYHNYFLEGDILRESCYECKYACSSREGDFSMGDYWGIEKAHAEIYTKYGVSVLLVNTAEGLALIDELKKYLDLTKSTFVNASESNSKLQEPTARSDRREAILQIWREGGYQAVAHQYYNANKKRIIMFRVKMFIPQSIKDALKRIFGIKKNSIKFGK